MTEEKKNFKIPDRKRTFIDKMVRSVNFLYPKCSSESVTIEITFNKLLANVRCSTCSLSGDIKINTVAHNPIDVYGEFIDLYKADEEIPRLEKKIENLKKLEKWAELTHTYSIMSDLYSKKGACLLKNENNPSPDEISNWNLKSEMYKKLEKEASLKRDSLRASDKSFKDDKGNIKKGKNIEDIFDDPGFLEF